MADEAGDPAAVDLVRLDQLADLMAECRARLHGLADDFHWRPRPASQAALDRYALQKHFSHAAAEAASPAPPAGYLDDAGIRSVVDGASEFVLMSEVVATYLDIAAGYLASMSALYRAREVFYGPLPLARSVVETSARVIWVLGGPTGATGPDAGAALARLARCYLEHYLSAELAKKTAGHLGGKTDPIHVDAKAHWEDVRQHIRQVFPDSTREELGRGELHEQKLPGPEAGVTALYDVLREYAGVALTSTEVEGIYDFLSSGTHPTLYQARQMRQLIDHGGHVGTEVSIDVDFLSRVTNVAVNAFYGAFTATASYFGATSTHIDLLSDAIDRSIPGAMRDPAPEAG